MTGKKVVNKQTKYNADLALKALYAQLNPHFIFNTLNSTQYLIKEQRNDEAISHLTKFAQIIRHYLSSSKNKFVPINEEVSILNLYMELQRLRFNDIFDYEIIVNDGLEHEYIPSLLLQPIIENAVIHGLAPKGEKGKLIIEFKRNENQIICTIDDNGIGREKSMAFEKYRKGESFGSTLIKDLIATFNEFEGIKIEMEYIDKKGVDSGTRVEVKIQRGFSEKGQ